MIRVVGTIVLAFVLMTALFASGASGVIPVKDAGSAYPGGFADERTVALWLFDEPHYPTMLLTDAGPNYWDLLLEARIASLEPGRFGNALTLSSAPGLATNWARNVPARRSRISPFDHSPRQMIAALAGTDWTIELWIRLAATPTEDVVIFEMGPRQPGAHTTLLLSAGGGPFVLRGDLPGVEFHCPVNNRILTDRSWHHVAFTYDHARRQMRHWMDGQPQVEAMPKGSTGDFDRAVRPGLVHVTDSGLHLAQPATASVDSQVHFSAASATPTSMLWTGQLRAPVTSTVVFDVEADDAVRLSLNGKPIITRVTKDGVARGPMEMRAGETHPFELKYYHPTEGPAFARLFWSWDGHARNAVPPDAFSHSAETRAVWSQLSAIDSAARTSGYVLSFGRSIDGRQPFQGQIDELRVSDVIRYKYREPFTPGTHSRNWTRQTRPSEPNGLPLLFGPNAETGAVPLGSRKHLFIDEVLVETKQNVRLTLNPPQDAARLRFKMNQPWDTDFGIDTFYDFEGKVRAVYYNGGMWKTQENVLSLAESGDGVNFERPETGTIEWRGSTKNNILSTYPGQGSWLVDTNPQCPPEERIKFLCFGMERAVHVFVSPDGIHLRRNETIGLFSDVGGGVECFWDDQRGKYVTHMRHEGFLRGLRGADGRAAFRAETREILKPWPMNRILNPQPDKITEEFPIPFKPGDAGQVYRTRALKYPWAPDAYFAFPWRMIGDHEIMQTELATSRDGIHWKFWGDKPFYLGVGDRKEGRILMCYGLIGRGDEIWQYAQTTEPSWVGQVAHVDNSDGHQILRFRQRIDGFVSLDAGEATGTVTTRDLIFQGRRLIINAAVKARLRVALLNPDGTEIPGFGLADCVPMHSDSTRHEVRWNGGATLASIEGYVVRVRFEMRDAKLYAFQFVP